MVLVPQVLERFGLAVAPWRTRLGLSPQQWARRTRGEVPWGEEEVATVLHGLHEMGRMLTHMKRGDLVEPRTPLRPATRRYATRGKSKK